MEIQWQPPSKQIICIYIYIHRDIYRYVCIYICIDMSVFSLLPRKTSLHSPNPKTAMAYIGFPLTPHSGSTEFSISTASAEAEPTNSKRNRHRPSPRLLVHAKQAKATSLQAGRCRIFLTRAPRTTSTFWF